jgi:hypothetical protein
MWSDEQCQRYNILREREHAGTLTEAEHAELAALMQELNDREASYLAAATHRKAQEIAETAAAVEQLEAQNLQLREYLRERQVFLARVRSLVDDIRAEDHRIRERFPDVLPLIGEPTTREPS